MSANELTLVSNVTPAILKVNFEELNERLDKELDKYRKVIISDDDGMKDAKAIQKELSALRTSLEASRKAIKKEAEKPIKDFDAKCKLLKEKISEVETPIQQAIDDHNNKLKEEKRKAAQEQIDDAVSRYGLRPEYASRMLLKPEFMNLTGTKKAVREDIAAQAEALKKEQDNFDKQVEIINNAVETENKRIKVKLKLDTFTAMLERGMDTVDILKAIREQADDIYEQENQKEEIAVDVTPLFIPQQSMPVETVPDAVQENSVYTEINSIPDAVPPLVPDCFIQEPSNIDPMAAMPSAGFVQDFEGYSNPLPSEPQFEVVFRATGNFETLRNLKDYLESKRITYETISQKRIKNS